MAVGSNHRSALHRSSKVCIKLHFVPHLFAHCSNMPDTVTAETNHNSIVHCGQARSALQYERLISLLGLNQDMTSRCTSFHNSHCSTGIEGWDFLLMAVGSNHKLALHRSSKVCLKLHFVPHMGHFPQDGKKEQNVSFFFFFWSFTVTKRFDFFKFSQLFWRDYVRWSLKILSFWS